MTWDMREEFKTRKEQIIKLSPQVIHDNIWQNLKLNCSEYQSVKS